MSDRLTWLIIGTIVALAAGYILGRRHGSAGARPDRSRPDVPEAAVPEREEERSPLQEARADGAPRSAPPPAATRAMPRQAERPTGGSFLPRAGARPPAATTQGGSGARTVAAPPLPTGQDDAAAPAPAPPIAPPIAPRRAAPASGRSAGRTSLAGVTSWGYQLQDLDIDAAAASPYDLIVIDHSIDGSQEGALSSADLGRLKRKPDGGRRIVISYLSIGEAESYRAYWQPAWKRRKPSWLLGENPEWPENYSVSFWDPEWQAILFGGSDSYLDKVIAQGFDGVYLDKCDVTDDLKTHFPAVARERRNLEGDMIDFVIRLAAHGRASRPGCVVIMQNAEPLLAHPELRAAIDGVGKEELYFGLDGGEGPNDAEAVDESRGLLRLAQGEGKAILCVEYLSDRRKQRQAGDFARQDGFTLFLSPKDRELASLGSGPLVA